MEYVLAILSSTARIKPLKAMFVIFLHDSYMTVRVTTKKKKRTDAYVPCL